VVDADGNRRTVPIVSEATAAAERELIVEAARRILAGDSLRGVVCDWNRRGITTTDGRPWRNQPLRRLLLSARVAGKRAYDGRLYDGHPTRLPAILDEATWEAVTAILTDPARRTSVGGGQPRHLLSGIGRCGVCGRPLRARMVAGGNGGRPHRAYYCHAPNLAGGGYHVRRNADKVDALIVGALFAAVESPAWDELAAERPDDDPTRPHYEALARITADLDVLDEMLAEAELAERQGATPKPSAATLRRKLAEREAARDRHTEAVNRLAAGRVTAAVPRNLRELWPDLSLDRRRNIVRAVLRLPPEGKGIQVHPQTGRAFDPDAIAADWRA
jgi:hypothetical protein